MSYWIYLRDEEGNNCEVENHEEGGTYVMGGTSEAALNVTYNYGKHFNFRELEGKTGAEVLQTLKSKVAELGVEQDDDYWNPTEGNVGHTLEIMRRWAEKHPTGTFVVH